MSILLFLVGSAVKCVNHFQRRICGSSHFSSL